MNRAPSAEQINMLLDFMSEHSDLARGLLRSIEGRTRTRALWKTLCNSLNALGRAHKSVKQWQKVWSDRKYSAKKAAAEARSSANRTGGGPSTASILSDIDVRIGNIMGDNYGGREIEMHVPLFPQEMQSDDLVEVLIIEDPPDETAEVTSESNSTPNANVEQGQIAEMEQASQSRIRRRGPGAREGRLFSLNARSRLFQMEEDRVQAEHLRAAELQSIRQALERNNETLQELASSVKTLTDVLKDYFNRQ